MQPRIQGKRVRYDDRPVSAPNVHSFRAPGLLPEHMAPEVENLLLIYINWAMLHQAATNGVRCRAFLQSASENLKSGVFPNGKPSELLD
jgi:hypothetical protein